MDDLRLGRRIRAIRQRLGWRQEDVASRAGVSQDAVSRVERGHLDATTISKVRSIARAIEADLVVTVRWRAGELDRLLDEGHAALVGRIVGLLGRDGWETRTEVSYSVYGERGSIDVLAWHEESRVLLVIEVKTELTSVEGTLRKHDEKVRLAVRIAEERFGWSAGIVSRLLVLPDDSTARRRVQRHDAVLRPAYPIRGSTLRKWLRGPEPSRGVVGGLLFVSPTRGVRRNSGLVARKRVRRLRSVPTTHSTRT